MAIVICKKESIQNMRRMNEFIVINTADGFYLINLFTERSSKVYMTAALNDTSLLFLKNDTEGVYCITDRAPICLTTLDQYRTDLKPIPLTFEETKLLLHFISTE
jgi:hypothetical protein